MQNQSSKTHTQGLEVTAKCLYHGGKSTGAKNPRVKHGYYTKAAIEERKMINQLLLKVKDTIAEIR